MQGANSSRPNPKERSGAVDHAEPDGLEQRHHEIAKRLPGSPDLRNNTTGKIILEKRQALTVDYAVSLPPHEIVEAGNNSPAPQPAPQVKVPAYDQSTPPKA